MNEAQLPGGTIGIALIFLVPFIAWRIYRRIKRNIGRQRSTAARHWFAASFYSVILLLLGLHSRTMPDSLLSLAGGITFGTLLAVIGLRLTRFERTAEGYFYTPSAHLGIALTLVFVGRIAYRFVELYVLRTASGVPPDFARSPLTLIVLGTMAGYFVVYAIGVLQWRSRQPQPPVEADAGPDRA